MANDVAATQNGSAGTQIVPVDQADSSIGVFNSDANFSAAQRMARALAASTLMPDTYRDNIPNVLIAMELAHRCGASVMMVAQNLDIIHGRPSWRSQFLIACVNSCGRFTPLRFRWQGKEGKMDWGCRAVAKELSSGEECLGTLITLQMANDEGWSKKSGSKWINLAELMLQYRAAAFWTRVFAPELTLGMQTSDEVSDVHAAYGTPAGAAMPGELVPKSPQSLEATLGLQPAADASAEPNASGETVDADGVVQSNEPAQQSLVDDKPRPRAR